MEVGVGANVAVGRGVAVRVGVAEGEGDGLGVALGIVVGEASGDGVAVEVGVGDRVDVTVAVAVAGSRVAVGMKPETWTLTSRVTVLSSSVAFTTSRQVPGGAWGPMANSHSTEPSSAAKIVCRSSGRPDGSVMVRIHSAPGAVLAVSRPLALGLRAEVTERMSRRRGAAVGVDAGAGVSVGLGAAVGMDGSAVTGGPLSGGRLGVSHGMGVGVSVRRVGVIVARGPAGFSTVSAFSWV
ncbi:MAG: hypothetical protein HYX92_02675 [Chloroflexi bacterium]|nr:hypothetical protein [Chloroflexota bacterium]